MAKSKKKTEEIIIRLADMNLGELRTKANEVTAQIQKKKLEMAVGRLKNTREVFNLRKELARIKATISTKNEVKSESPKK